MLNISFRYLVRLRQTNKYFNFTAHFSDAINDIFSDKRPDQFTSEMRAGMLSIFFIKLDIMIDKNFY